MEWMCERVESREEVKSGWKQEGEGWDEYLRREVFDEGVAARLSLPRSAGVVDVVD